MSDPFDLERFVTAQNTDGTYEHARRELRDGRKKTHWMWFVFPQIAGLGHSPLSRMYAISSVEEATAYGRHQVLGPRLLECTGIVTASSVQSAVEMVGVIDAQKLHSSMTLFSRALPAEPLFGKALDRYFHGTTHAATNRLLMLDPSDLLEPEPGTFHGEPWVK